MYAAALAIALTACTAQAEEPAADPDTEQGSAEVEAAGFEEPGDPYAPTDPELTERLHLPLYDYNLDEYEQWTIRRAQDVLTVDCLDELGFEASVSWETDSLEELLTHFGPHHSYRRYGVASTDLAEEYGFGIPEGDDTGNPWTVADASQEEAAADAYTGFSHTGGEIETPSGDPAPEGGCKHQANLGINPDSPPPGEDGYWSATEGEPMPDTPGLHSRVDDLLGESYSAGMEDPAVEAANEAWKECAGLSGYTVGPGGASEVMGEGGDAVLSAECADTSGYLDAFVAAETRAQEAMVEEHRAELEERREQLDAELAAARTVLGW
ncbi:hypothetical protein [Nocardiopsis metallicus]|uniref:Uncharacterized protein n=1 Tax=Nocardiopsis metallicus TaxID=179819 RepID=A0A840WE00_9ACTN|nr:hypothetical protein [Nocardiopsis metallicus]MBB5489556.1 hypothetical protein [Nocardiopsis metallicus]